MFEDEIFGKLELLPCPSYTDDPGVRCSMPAEVVSRDYVGSTDGPVGIVSIRCLDGHIFRGPMESLTF